MERDEEVEVTRDPGKVARLVMDFPTNEQMFGFWRDVVHPALRSAIPDMPYSLTEKDYGAGQLPRTYREFQVTETDFEELKKPQFGERVYLMDYSDEEVDLSYTAVIVAYYGSNYDALEGGNEKVLWEVEVSDVEDKTFEVYWDDTHQAWFMDITTPADHGLE